MNSFLKGAFIFTGGIAGGFVLCGVTTIKLIIKSDTFRTAVKDKISDEITTFLYGENNKTKSGYTSSRKSYRSYYEHRKVEKPFENIVFETRKDAEDVLSQVDDICKMYGLVTVSDLYDLCGLTGTLKDYKVGWKDLTSASIIRTKFGYLIRLPIPTTV